jgi:hypothetical protein
MKKHKYLLLLIALVSMALASCESDDPVTPSNVAGDEAYLPNTVGNYWVYKNTAIDKDSGEEKTDEATHDSLAVTGVVSVGATHYDVYRNHFDIYDESDDISLEYKDINMKYGNQKIDVSSAFIFPTTGSITKITNYLLGEDFSLPEYVTIADFAATAEWELISPITVDTLPEIEIEGFVANLKNVRYNAVAAKGAEEDLEYNGTTHKAQQFIITHKILTNGKLAIPNMGETELEDLALDIKFSLYFVKNIGLVKRSMDPVKVSVPFGVAKIPVKLSDGSKSMLIRNMIK